MFLKKLVRKIVIRVRSAQTSRILKKTTVQKLPDARRKLIWTAPRIATNVGDRALSIGSLAGVGFANGHLFTRDIFEPITSQAKFTQIDKAVEVAAGSSFGRAFLTVARGAADCDQVFFVGADMMDGKYNPLVSARKWELATWFQKNVGPTSVISMSWNESPKTQAIAGVKSAVAAGVKIFVRDELSKNRLAKLGINATLAFDVSFIATDQKEPSQESGNWFDNAKKNVIVTVSDWVVENPTMKSLLINSLRSIEENYRFVYVPMVTDGQSRDREACVELSELLGGFVLPELPEPAELRWMAQRSAFEISARMHCCLVGFAAGLPAIGIEYQGKFKGAFKAFDLERFVIAPEEFAEKFGGAFAEIVSRHDEIRQEILNKLPAVQQSARLPFS